MSGIEEQLMMISIADMPGVFGHEYRVSLWSAVLQRMVRYSALLGIHRGNFTGLFPHLYRASVFPSAKCSEHDFFFFSLAS